MCNGLSARHRRVRGIGTPLVLGAGVFATLGRICRRHGSVFLLQGIAVKPSLMTTVLATGSLACLYCTPADAHLNSTGMGPIYDGLLHFFSSPQDVIPVVALALFAGLRGPAYGRRTLFILPASWLVGCLLGTLAQHPTSWPVAGVSFLIFGGLVAADGWAARGR
jgi:hypothetical protein